MQKKSRSPAPHLVNPGWLPLTTDPRPHRTCRRAPSRSWRSTLQPTPSAWKGRNRVSRHPVRRIHATQSLKGGRGEEGRIQRLADQNCDSFCDPTRTLYSKAPANFEASRSKSALPPSLLFFCSSSTNTTGGRPKCRKRLAPRLPTLLTWGRCRSRQPPYRTVSKGGRPVVRGG